MRKFSSCFAAILAAVLALVLPWGDAGAQESTKKEGVPATKVANEIKNSFLPLEEMRVGETRWVMPYRVYATYPMESDFSWGVLSLAGDTPTGSSIFTDDRYSLTAVAVTRLEDDEPKFLVDWTDCKWHFALDPLVAQLGFRLKGIENGAELHLGRVNGKKYFSVILQRGETKLEKIDGKEIWSRLYEAKAYGEKQKPDAWVSSRFLHFGRGEKGSHHETQPAWIDAWAPFSREQFEDELGQAVKVTIRPMKSDYAGDLQAPWDAILDLTGVSKSRRWETPLDWVETSVNPKATRITFRDRTRQGNQPLRALAWVGIAQIKGDTPKGEAAKISLK